MTRCSVLFKAAKSILISAGVAAHFVSCAPSVPASLVPADWPSWRKATNIELNYPIPGHEDKYRVIRINNPGWDYAVGSTMGRMEFPSGTIIAKEIYATSAPAVDEKPLRLTVMIKTPDSPDARGGWIWVVKDLQSGSETIMKGAFCYTCHNNANEAHPYGDKNPNNEYRDFVFLPPGRDGMSLAP